MDNNKLPNTAEMNTVTLTDTGRIALAAHTLAVAEKSRDKQRRKALCEQVIGYLRPVVQA